MRYAVVSDLHANLPAWESVLADLQHQAVDLVVCLGDVVGYGPNPVEVLRGVRQVSSNFVMGNHDAAAVGKMDVSIFNDHARHSVEWTASQLDEDAAAFLRQVPLAIDAGEILFVHGEILEPGRFHYINDVDEARENFAKYSHLVTFLGHTHLPKGFEMDPSGQVVELLDQDMVLNPDCRYIINVGSVGEPRNREDLRARYVVYDSETRGVVFRRVPFDIEKYRRHLDATTLGVRPFFLAVFEEAEDTEEVLAATQADMSAMSGARYSALLSGVSGAPLVAALKEYAPDLRSARASRMPMIVVSVLSFLTMVCVAYWILKKDDPPTVPLVGEEGKDSEKGSPSADGTVNEPAETTSGELSSASLPKQGANPPPEDGKAKDAAESKSTDLPPGITDGIRRLPVEVISKQSVAWSEPANWVGGKLPGGSDDVILEPGARAYVYATKIADPPTGSLVLKSGAMLHVFKPGGHDVLPKGDSKIYMYKQSKLYFRTPGDSRIGMIEIMGGDAWVLGGYKGAGRGGKRVFTEPVSGSGRLVLRGVKNNLFLFQSHSTFEGTLLAQGESDKQPFQVLGMKNGCFGRANVIAGSDCSLHIAKGLTDTIHDDQTLVLSGRNGDLARKLFLESDETVGRLVINEKPMKAGIYTKESLPKWIAGNGKLTVRFSGK